jgi:hypothetical protein
MHDGARGESENLVFHLVWTGVWPNVNEQQVHEPATGALRTLGRFIRDAPIRRHLFVILYGSGRGSPGEGRARDMPHGRCRSNVHARFPTHSKS